jgi:hypothetical protein
MAPFRSSTARAAGPKVRGTVARKHPNKTQHDDDDAPPPAAPSVGTSLKGLLKGLSLGKDAKSASKASGGSNKASCGPDKASGGPNKASGGPNKASGGPNKPSGQIGRASCRERVS